MGGTSLSTTGVTLVSGWDIAVTVSEELTIPWTSLSPCSWEWGSS